MTDAILKGVVAGLQAMSGWEVVAVGLGLAYLVLAMRQNAWCWYAAFGSTAIYTGLFWSVSLPMESVLNAYYLAMALYGWWAWRSGHAPDAGTKAGAKTDAGGTALPIIRWAWHRHALALLVVGTLTMISGYLLSEHTNAALPYLDSFTTWGAVLTTWMVTRKVLENWLYWIVVDGAAAVLFFERALYLTSLLMVVYVGMVIIGWFRWRAQYQQQRPDRVDHTHHRTQGERENDSAPAV